MKKLGKKVHDNIETIEAYCSCSDRWTCVATCHCGRYSSDSSVDSSLWKSHNDQTYNAANEYFSG